MVNAPFKPTEEERKLVEQMGAVGIPQESICLVVRDGIDDKTLRKAFQAGTGHLEDQGRCEGRRGII